MAAERFVTFAIFIKRNGARGGFGEGRATRRFFFSQNDAVDAAALRRADKRPRLWGSRSRLRSPKTSLRPALGKTEDVLDFTVFLQAAKAMTFDALCIRKVGNSSFSRSDNGRAPFPGQRRDPAKGIVVFPGRDEHLVDGPSGPQGFQHGVFPDDQTGFVLGFPPFVLFA
jgi:hypothetical protein